MKGIKSLILINFSLIILFLAPVISQTSDHKSSKPNSKPTNNNIELNLATANNKRSFSEQYKNNDFFFKVRNKKQELGISTKQLAISVKNSTPKELIDQLIKQEGAISSDVKKMKKTSLILIKLKQRTNRQKVLQITDRLSRSNLIEFASPVFTWKNDNTKLILNDELIVKFKANTQPEQTLKEQSAIKIAKKIKWQKNTYLLKTQPKSKNALDIANLLTESPEVEYAYPNFFEQLDKHDTFPNDPNFSKQWNLHNIGQIYPYNNVDKDIDAPEGWDIGIGNPNITVAVIDEGVDVKHEDLKYKIVAGADMTNLSSPDGIPGNADIYSPHGTATAGIIGASTNNSLGIAGVAWNVRIMPVRIGSSLSSATNGFWTTAEWAANGIAWAADNGADVLSNSWGGGPDSPLIRDAIVYATTNGRNGLGSAVIFSAGNSGYSTVAYPAKYIESIAVGATDQCDVLKNSWGYGCNGDEWDSNYGQDLDVVAPGVDIATTDLSGSQGYSYSSYTDEFGGTSASAPQVAGLAALILSENPNLTQEKVRQVIQESADDQVGLSTGYSYRDSPGWDQYYGYGRINIQKSLSHPLVDSWLSNRQPMPYSSLVNVLPRLSALVNTSIVDPDTIQFKLDNQAVTYDYDPATTEISYQTQTALSDGNHDIEITGQGLSGGLKTKNWSFSVDISGPVISNLMPAAGSTINNPWPQISATITDTASLVDESSVKVFLDNLEIAYNYDLIIQTLTFNPQTLTNGSHTIRIVARDIYQNETVFEWSFNVSAPFSIGEVSSALFAKGIENGQIIYSLNQDATVNTNIFDSNNILVRQLEVNQFHTFGKSSVAWDGKDDNGNDVADGNYSVIINAQNSNQEQISASVNIDVVNNPYSIVPDSGALTGSALISLEINPLISSRYQNATFYQQKSGATYWSSLTNLSYPYKSFTWKTTSYQDGAYDVKATVSFMRSENTIATVEKIVSYTLDNPLTLDYFDILYPLISLNGDDRNYRTFISARFSRAATATLSFFDADSNIIKTFTKEAYGEVSFDWNAIQDNGLPVPDGKYKVILSAIDSGGDVASNEGSPEYIYVAKEPLRITTPANGSVIKGAQTIRAEYSPFYPTNQYGLYPSMYFYYKAENKSWDYFAYSSSKRAYNDFQSNLDTSQLADGSYQIKVDRPFWADIATEEYIVNYTIDNTAPSQPTNLIANTQNNTVNLSWTASNDTTSGVKEYEVERSSDGSVFSKIGVSSTTDYIDNDLPLGAYYYQVRAVDNAGNLSSYSDVVSVTLADTIPPTTDISISGTMGSNNYYISQPLITLNTSDSGGSGLSGTEYSFDSINWNTYLGPFTITNEGQTTIYYRSTDNAGNTETTKQIPVKVDTEKPINITNLSAVPNTSNQVVISWDASADITSGIKEYAVEKSTDNITFTEIARVTSTTYTDSVSSVGIYYYRVKAIDNASNESDYASVNASIVNNIINASFEFDSNTDGIPDNWSPYLLSSGDGRSADYYSEGGYSFKIAGETNKYKRITQRLNLSGLSGQTFTLSAYSKAIGNSATGGCVDVVAYLNNTDGSKTMYGLMFSKSPHDWIYRSKTFTATKNFSSIDIFVVNYLQTGTAYFDKLTLLKL